MSTKNWSDAEFEAHMEEKEWELFLLDPEDGEDYDESDWDYEDDCPLDGDAQSALASCGWGTDEDYGYYEADPYDCWQGNTTNWIKLVQFAPGESDKNYPNYPI